MGRTRPNVMEVGVSLFGTGEPFTNAAEPSLKSGCVQPSWVEPDTDLVEPRPQLVKSDPLLAEPSTSLTPAGVLSKPVQCSSKAAQTWSPVFWDLPLECRSKLPPTARTSQPPLARRSPEHARSRSRSLRNGSARVDVGEHRSRCHGAPRGIALHTLGPPRPPKIQHVWIPEHSQNSEDHEHEI